MQITRTPEEGFDQNAAALQEFRGALDLRLASLDEGRGLDGESVFVRLRQKSDGRRRSRVRADPSSE